jgi:hypothetical protein
VLLGAENRVFLVLPLNVAAGMPAELEYLSPIIWKELESYLRAHDKQLKTVSRKVARNLWIRCIQQVRGGEQGARAGYDDAMRALALELRNHAEFDALIAPSPVLRRAARTGPGGHRERARFSPGPRGDARIRDAARGTIRATLRRDSTRRTPRGQGDLLVRVEN